MCDWMRGHSFLTSPAHFEKIPPSFRVNLQRQEEPVGITETWEISGWTAFIIKRLFSYNPVEVLLFLLLGHGQGPFAESVAELPANDAFHYYVHHAMIYLLKKLKRLKFRLLTRKEHSPGHMKKSFL